MTEQLIFDLPIREALGRDAFFVAPSNAIALATLDTADLWPSRKLVLTGTPGAGKTHMAHVWAVDNNASIISAEELLETEIPALAAQKYVVVEDADKIANHIQALDIENALFHLHNLILAEGGYLLVTASVAPNHWTLGLPDLASRMQGTSVARIDPPDDKLLCAMLLKQFDDRQIAISSHLIPYLVKRMERSAEGVRSLVEALDSAALRENKPISRNLASEIIDTLGQKSA